MKKWIKRLSSFGLLIASLSIYSQNLPLGGWRTHFSYNSVKSILNAEDRIFCASENGLFYIRKSDRSLYELSKIDGLSDVAISAMAYDPTTKTLLLGYPSGLIDLVSEDAIVTLNDIYKTNLQGNKRIQDISISGERAYLSTSFGIITVSLSLKEITETYASIGAEGSKVTVLDTEIIGNELFAITDDGIQSGLVNTNLLDFNNWTHYPETTGDNRDFAVLNDQIYSISNEDSLIRLSSGVWKTISSDNTDILALLTNNGSLYLLTADRILSFDGVSFGEEILLNQSTVANDFIFDNGFWIADDSKGLITPDKVSILPNGPLSDQISNLRIARNELYAFYSPEVFEYLGTSTVAYYSQFDLFTWASDSIDEFPNISDVAYLGNQKYFSSIGFGVINATQNEIYPLTNSKSDFGSMVPKLMARGGNLYGISYNNSNPLLIIDGEGNLIEIQESNVGTDRPIDLNISNGNILWITRSSLSGGGILTVDVADNEIRQLTGTANLPSLSINDISINSTDEAWIATGGGPAFFSDATYIFDDFEAILPIFDGFTLFEDLNVSALISDGGNRVWMSTNQGVFVFDEAITEILEHFTTENSPLPSNSVLEFEYNPQNGELFILTDKGLVSYQTLSSNPSPTHELANIYPNPVRPNYTGLVGISGLSYDASVKVTDVNGKLVKKLTVNGGTASWDLRDYNNMRVSSGVYILFSSSGDGLQTYIGKLAVIN